ncbi:hypothetical protein UM93_08945 [Psychromicrobium lacuslunae]|uniref:PBP domain-containing protein n=1 Tax=Psychromicrobium lacuslunae TaxID=1618207 RepID=A0A0D4C3Q5_9MICC|nr:hypothetical protein UM93_08945 [Psychromicrobium lacuslunae]
MLLALLLTALLSAVGVMPASAAYPRISGEGSSWAGNALDQWKANVGNSGAVVDYAPSGSSQGRKNFANGLADFAVSEIPYTGDTADPQDQGVEPNFKYSMLPVVAGGTSFMYNLKVAGKRFERLNLSQSTLAKIFSGQIDNWNNPAIKADNPGVTLPNQRLTVVVRSDGSGATAQFTLWMLRQFPQDYAKLCQSTGQCKSNSATSYYPTQGLGNFVSQKGSDGVTGYVKSNQFTINYDEYSYALNAALPVANIKNAAGFFLKPTAQNVAVALVKAKINMDSSSKNYLAQDLSEVYSYTDPRSYPLSAYSYMITPAQTTSRITADKGSSVGFFATYSLCEGQLSSEDLGYSPLPMNLVLAAMQQVRKIPGLDAATVAKLNKTSSGVTSGSSNPCNNPTFKPGDNPKQNQLVLTAPFPTGCAGECQNKAWALYGIKGKPIQKTVDNTGNPSTGGDDGTKNQGGAGAGAGGGNQQSTKTDGSQTSGSKSTKKSTASGATNQKCDPDTGVCGDAGTQDGAGNAPVAGVPTTLASAEGWGAPQNLLILVGVLIVLLVLAPPLTARMVNRPRRDDQL